MTNKVYIVSVALTDVVSNDTFTKNIVVISDDAKALALQDLFTRYDEQEMMAYKFFANYPHYIRNITLPEEYRWIYDSYPCRDYSHQFLLEPINLVQ